MLKEQGSSNVSAETEFILADVLCRKECVDFRIIESSSYLS